MGLFGGKDDTQSKIEELKARMQQQHMPPQQGPPDQGWQQPQQPWQQPQQSYQAPEQPWQQQPQVQEAPRRSTPQMSYRDDDTLGIILDLGDGMSLNLPIRERMKLDEFLQVADRVRELKRIDHQGQQGQQHF